MSLHFYGDIKRVSGDDERMVWGYASTDEAASDGQTITRDALSGALDDYMRFANIRAMHRSEAVGTAMEAEMDDRGLYVGAYIQDDDAWAKVKTKVYRGFSIGAKVTNRDPGDRKIVRGIRLMEISLVDRPGDPGAVFDVYRCADATEDDEFMKSNTTQEAGASENQEPAAIAPEAAATETTAVEAETVERVDAPSAEAGGDGDIAATPEIDELYRRKWNAAERKAAAKSGSAMKDGSFPIEDKGDLEDAIQAFGRAKNKAAAKRHIMKRAKDLGEDGMIPDDWKKGVKRAAGIEGDDLVTRATAAADAALAAASSALEKVERAVRVPETDTELPGTDLRRGLGTVNQLGWLLSELAYIAKDAMLESAIEGDNSPVPNKLRAALVELVNAYRAMSDEEMKELLKKVNVDVSLENGIIQLMACGADIERGDAPTISDVAAARLQGALDGLIARGFSPSVDGLVDVLTDERDTLLRSVTGLTEQMNILADRLLKVETQPLPAKTAGPGAAVTIERSAVSVDKGEDASGQQPAKPSLSPDDIKRHLESLNPEDRADLLVRAALARPHVIR